MAHTGTDFAAIRTTIRRLGLAAPLAVASAVLPPLGGFLILGTVTMVAPWLRSHEIEGMLMFIGAYTLLGALALLPTYAASLLAGWAFGVGQGIATAMVSYLLAALCCYLIVVRLAGGALREYIREHEKAEAIYQALVGGSFLKTTAIVTLLRIPPNAPFATSNVVFAAGKVPVLSFTIGTVLGLFPRSFAVVYLGAGLSEFDPRNTGSTAYFAIGIIVTLAVLFVITTLSKQALARLNSVR